VLIVDDDGRAVFLGSHRGDDFVERSVRRHGVGFPAHRFFDQHLAHVHVAEGLDELEVAIGEHAEQLAAVKDGQVANVVLAHHAARRLERLFSADRVRRGGHVLPNCGDWLAHRHGVEQTSGQRWFEPISAKVERVSQTTTLNSRLAPTRRKCCAWPPVVSPSSKRRSA
jgi:hypothetical protein